MIYFVTGLEDQSWWGLAGRQYLLALLGADAEVRFLPLNSNVGFSPEDIDPEFDPILKCFGGGGQATASIIHGSAQQLAERAIRTPDLIGPHSIALTTWGTENVTDNVLRGLRAYTEVWVPSKNAARAMRKSGLEHVEVVWPPITATAWVNTAAGRPADRFVFYAIGSWGELDNTEKVVRAYLAEFKRAENVLLHLICPDAPFGDAAGIAKFAGAPDPQGLPRVSMDTTWGRALVKSPSEWRQLHKCCHCYVTASTRYDLDPWALAAGAAGNLICGAPAQFMALEDDPLGQATIDAAEYKTGGVDVEELGDGMRRALENPPKLGKLGNFRFLPRTGHRMLELLKTLDERHAAASELPEESPKAAEATAVVEQAGLQHTSRVGVVVPHKDRGRDWLEAVWACVKGQLGSEDCFVVSDQGSAASTLEDVERFVMGIGATLVTSEPPECGWSLSLARNAGAKVAADLGAELLFFVDADILLPPGAIDGLATVIEGTHPRATQADLAVPLVAQSDRFLYASELPLRSPPASEETRPGSGCAMVPTQAFVEAHGYDETYVGWGSEDIDLLARMEKLGSSKLLHEEVVLRHQPHEESPYKAQTGKVNQAKSMVVLEASESPVVNKDGWGDGVVAIMKGDRL